MALVDGEKQEMVKTFFSDRERHRYYNSLSEEQKYDAFCDILFDSEHVVFLGGAGVSTESGIPDFRSKNGLYKKRVKAFGRYKPEYLLSSECLRTQPELFFKDRMEPFESHIEQKEAVYEGVTVRQIRRKMKTVDHEIQRFDACTEKHEDHEHGEKDLLGLISFLIKFAEIPQKFCYFLLSGIIPLSKADSFIRLLTLYHTQIDITNRVIYYKYFNISSNFV